MPTRVHSALSQDVQGCAWNVSAAARLQWRPCDRTVDRIGRGFAGLGHGLRIDRSQGVHLALTRVTIRLHVWHE